MTLWTSQEVAEATGGTTAAPWQATGVSIDTRTLQEGDLFVALSDVRDGHDFVHQALEKAQRRRWSAVCRPVCPRARPC